MVEAASEKFFVVETEITDLNRKINVVHDAALHRHGEVMGKFDFISRLDEKLSVVAAEISTLNRRTNGLDDTVLRQHGDILSRFDAVGARLEEIESLPDDRPLDIKRTQIEIVSQYNGILTALQPSTNASSDVHDPNERLSALERRMQA